MSVAPQAWLSILGIGEDGVEGLSPAARSAIVRAVLVVGGARHLALVAPLIQGAQLPWPSPLSDAFPTILEYRGRPVTILASGDPFFYGVGNNLASVLAPAELVCLPGPSAVSLACARLGWAVQEVATVSACGRPLPALLPLLHPRRRILVLSADATTPVALAAILSQYGFGDSTLHLLEALGGPRERLRSQRACDPLPIDIAPLNLVGIEVVSGSNARIIPRTVGLPDEMYAHDGQITKWEIRAVTLAALAPRVGELLWDIGCGSGSIACEWALAHPANRAIGIEALPDRAERARRNTLTLGVPAVRIVSGTAPAALAGLPAPDAVFIGGGGQSLALLGSAWEALASGGRMVMNAVTIETEVQLFAAYGVHGGTLTRLTVERLHALGHSHGFRPAITVTQWTARKP